MTTSRINFGILINLNINNNHYLQDFDRLQHHMTKIDVYNYLETFDRQGYSNNEDMIDDGVKMFDDDAKWVKSFDGCGEGTSFYLVCYLTDKEGNPTGIEKIKELFYK